MHYAKDLLRENRIPIFEGKEISTYLGLSEKLINFIRLHPENFYKSFPILKKNGDPRLIQAPRLYLKVIQHYILDCILSTAEISEVAFGFARNRSPSDGAKKHEGCRFLWNIDLKDFFPTISRDKVISVFQNLGYTKQSASWLSAICCLNGRLPQGAPTSPALSNIVFLPVDNLIKHLCISHNIVYSRYADDLSFSSLAPIDEKFREAVLTIILASDFEINPNKERLVGPCCRREVTGLTVNEKVSIPRHKRREVRALFHQVSSNPTVFTSDRSRLAGIAGWVYQHHPETGKVYLEILEKIPTT